MLELFMWGLSIITAAVVALLCRILIAVRVTLTEERRRAECPCCRTLIARLLDEAL